MVEIAGLTKRFARGKRLGRNGSLEDVLAVDGVDLRLNEGEIFGLVGPNGAGKTTLIKLLTTLLRPSSGSARVAGHDVLHEAAAVRGLVGLVTSNERSFYWRLTGRQNLSFFASLYDLPGREARRWITELFELLDLEDKADERFDSYSTGMRQRLAFARGLLPRPRLLLMDEPTKGVDPVSRAEMLRVMREVIVERWNPTILIASHNLSEIEQLCGRIGLMNEGRLLSVGTLPELRELVRTVRRYVLDVRGLAEGELTSLANEYASHSVSDLEHHNGSIRLSLGFSERSDGFAGFVRAVVENGGDLAACESEEESLDQIFHRLLDMRARRVP